MCGAFPSSPDPVELISIYQEKEVQRSYLATMYGSENTTCSVGLHISTLPQYSFYKPEDWASSSHPFTSRQPLDLNALSNKKHLIRTSNPPQEITTTQSRPVLAVPSTILPLPVLAPSSLAPPSR